jgi:hypothetical protein
MIMWPGTTGDLHSYNRIMTVMIVKSMLPMRPERNITAIWSSTLLA